MPGRSKPETELAGSAETVSAAVGPHRNETEVTRQRYNRIAPIYDALEWMMELRFRGWRKQLWDRVEGEDILELGVGTGKNIRFYPSARQVTAIDISEGMLERARKKANRLGSAIELQVADAQQLPYDDHRFDTVVATFLFCSVPDPVLALGEARRVLRSGGQLLLLEHVLSELPVLRPLMELCDPIPYRIWGAHINRDALASVYAAGFEDVQATNLSLDIVKRIEALAPSNRAS